MILEFGFEIYPQVSAAEGAGSREQDVFWQQMALSRTLQTYRTGQRPPPPITIAKKYLVHTPPSVQSGHLVHTLSGACNLFSVRKTVLWHEGRHFTMCASIGLGGAGVLSRSCSFSENYGITIDGSTHGPTTITAL
jgi:hypothetical protein